MLAMKIYRSKISWDNTAYLRKCWEAKMEKEMGAQRALFIIARSSNRTKENIIKQDGNRSVWKGSGPQRGLIVKLTV